MTARQDRLLSWATDRGAYLHPSVEIHDDPNTGLSFRVKSSASAIAANEPIVRIPSSLTLSFANAVGIPRYAFRYKDILLKRLPPHVIGRLLLVREYLADEASFWQPYLMALPLPDYDDSWKLPPFWSEQERLFLKGTNLETGAETIVETLKREYEDIQEALKEAGDDYLAKGVTYELYCWAYCMFSSRSFRPSLVLSKEEQEALPEGVKVDDFSVLMPLFDIGNHDMTVPVRWELVKGAGDPSSPHLFRDENEPAACQLRVGKAFAPGEQVFNNYSAKSNAELLLGYNFIIPPTEALHNDYIHLRKRGGAANEEYFVSLRPVSDPSSVMIRSKMGANVEALKGTLPAFAHVQPEMIWDIVTMVMDEEQRQAAMPVEGDEAKMAMLLAGKVAPEYRPLLEQLVGTIQGKLIQELEKLEEFGVEVDEEDMQRLCGQQLLALEYRHRCQAVLEAALTAINDDPYFF